MIHWSLTNAWDHWWASASRMVVCSLGALKGTVRILGTSSSWGGVSPPAEVPSSVFTPSPAEVPSSVVTPSPAEVPSSVVTPSPVEVPSVEVPSWSGAPVSSEGAVSPGPVWEEPVASVEGACPSVSWSGSMGWSSPVVSGGVSWAAGFSAGSYAGP